MFTDERQEEFALEEGEQYEPIKVTLPWRRRAKIAMKDQGLNHRKLTDRTGCCPGHLSNIFGGKTGKSKWVVPISDALGISAPGKRKRRPRTMTGLAQPEAERVAPRILKIAEFIAATCPEEVQARAVKMLTELVFQEENFRGI